MFLACFHRNYLSDGQRLAFYKMTAEKENTSLNVTTAIVTDNDDKLQLMKGKRLLL